VAEYDRAFVIDLIIGENSCYILKCWRPVRKIADVRAEGYAKIGWRPVASCRRVKTRSAHVSVCQYNKVPLAKSQREVAAYQQIVSEHKRTAVFKTLSAAAVNTSEIKTSP
jgi:hypothetical protein